MEDSLNRHVATAYDTFSYSQSLKRKFRKLNDLIIETNLNPQLTSPRLSALTSIIPEETETEQSFASNYLSLDSRGNIVNANEAAISFFQLNPDQLSQSNLLQFIHQSFREQFQEYFKHQSPKETLECGRIVLISTNQLYPMSIWLKRKTLPTETVFICVLQRILGELVVENQKYKKLDGNGDFQCFEYGNRVFPAIRLADYWLILFACAGVLVTDENFHIKSLNESSISYLTGYPKQNLVNESLSKLSLNLADQVSNSKDQCLVLNSLIRHSTSHSLHVQLKIMNYIKEAKSIVIWIQFCQDFNEITTVDVTQDYKLSLDDLQLQGLLGEGTYSYVREGFLKTYPDKKVIVKIILRNRVADECWIRHQNKRLPREIAILETIKSKPHPNLLNMISFDSDFDYIYVFFDHLGDDSMNLSEFLQATPVFDKLKIMKQLMDALKHLHSLGIIHRDIKNENILVDSELNVTLIDFGSAIFSNEPESKISFFAGTLEYAAPEVVNGTIYNGFEQDIWSLGIVLYQLEFQQFPLQLEFATSTSSLCNLIKRMLSREPSERPLAHQLLL